MTYMMKKHTTIFQFRPDGIKSLLLMLLLLVMGVGESVGQIEEGFYYIQNENKEWYLCTSTNNYNGNADTPYLRTKKNPGQAEIWEIKKDGDYYNIIHYSDGKYVVANSTAAGAYQVVHLETIADVSALTETQRNAIRFSFLSGSNSSTNENYGIFPYGLSTGKDDATSFNPHSGNGNGSKGDIGYWKCNGDASSRWLFVPVTPPMKAPKIKIDGTTCTITCEIAGAAIYYTTNGADPTVASTMYTGPFSVGDAEKVKAIATKDGYLVSSIVTKYVNGYEPKYIAIHKLGVGYLKINSANVALSNDGNFRYADAFNNDGASIWVLTEEGYLKNQYYYLNVVDKTPYLSVDPVTSWELEEINDNGKMSIKYNDLYLASSSGIKLVDNADLGYHACPITITEKEWSGPTTNAVTVQSPQQITYLRHYYTQKMDYTFINR